MVSWKILLAPALVNDPNYFKMSNHLEHICIIGYIPSPSWNLSLELHNKVVHSLYTNVLTLLVDNKKINVLQVSLTSCIFPKKKKKKLVYWKSTNITTIKYNDKSSHVLSLTQVVNQWFYIAMESKHKV